MEIDVSKDVENSIHAAVRSGRFSSVGDAVAAAWMTFERQNAQGQAVAREPEVAAEATRQTRPIWEEILELTADVPDEEWDKLPTDLAEQHDHYIYGTPKRPFS